MPARKFLKIDGWWPSHFGTIMASIYSILADSRVPPPLHELISYLFLFIIANLGIGTFGILLNDFADLEQDRRSGVRNLLISKGKYSRLCLLLLVALIAVVPWFWIPLTPLIVILITCELLLFFLYSMPPIRLKERGWLGVFADSLYGYVVPNAYGVLLFSELSQGSHHNMLLIAILAWCLVFGIERIIYHQLLDSSNDEKSGANTFVIQLGWRRAFLLNQRYIVPVMLLATVALMLVWLPISCVVPVFFLIHTLAVLSSYFNSRLLLSDPQWSHPEFYHLVVERLVGTFIWRWLSVLSLTALIVKVPSYWPLVPFQLILFPEPVRWLRYEIYPHIAQLARRTLPYF